MSEGQAVTITLHKYDDDDTQVTVTAEGDAAANGVRDAYRLVADTTQIDITFGSDATDVNMEAALAVLIHRMESYNGGSDENGWCKLAAWRCRQALDCLHDRTKNAGG